MRFSLMTLLLISLWIGAGLGLWFRREAWVFERFVPAATQERISFGMTDGSERLFAPDHARFLALGNPFSEVTFWIGDTRSEKPIYVHARKGELDLPILKQFESNDSILLDGVHPQTRDLGQAHYRRRFPEWWWGHFYRPEVWAFAVLSIALIVRGVQALRRGRLARAV